MKRTVMSVVCACLALLVSAADPKDSSCRGPKDDGSGSSSSNTKQSIDPNEMAGPAGLGSSRCVKTGEWLDYTIYFENKSDATAAAQEIFITLPKDTRLDWTTYELGEVVFGDHIDLGLTGKQHGESSYKIPDSTESVKTKVEVYENEIRWYLRSWDPNTADHFPADAVAGFLPPNDDSGRGEGHVRYRVKVKENVEAGSIIAAKASIVFDTNPPIETDPAWWNTVGQVVTVEGLDGKNATVMVDPKWVLANIGPGATSEQIAAFLNQVGKNGQKVWTSVALGLDPESEEQKLVVDVPQNDDENTVPIKTITGDRTVECWASVKYRLESDKGEGSKPAAGAKALLKGYVQDSTEFSVDIGGVDDPTGIYKVTAVFSDDEGTEFAEVPAANQIGIMRKKAANKREIVPVPWTKFAAGAEDIAVSNLVKTAGLSAGDKLYVYDDSAKRYATWELQSDKTWKPVKTVKMVNGKLEVQTADSPEVATVKRGSGVWLERHDITKPIHFVGQHDAAPVEVPVEAGTTAMPKWNLVASPLLTDWDLNSVSEGVNVADRIIVPTGKEPRIYTRDATNAKWGYITYEANAKGIVKPVRKEDDTMLKAGTGFWYVSEGGAPTLRWREASEK